MTSRDEILARVMQQISALNTSDAELTPNSNLIADTSLDSVSVMDLVMELEDEFDIAIPLDWIAEIKTIDQIADAVWKLANDR